MEPRQLLAGELTPVQAEGKGKGQAQSLHVKVLILPKVLSLSDEEAEALRRFARTGGVVIADGACGTFDGHGKRRKGDFYLGTGAKDDACAVGALDRDFGIARTGLGVLECNGAFHGGVETRVRLKTPGGPSEADGGGAETGPESSDLRVLEPSVVANGGRSHGASRAGAAALLSKARGKGRFVYLNLSMQDYAQRRADKDAGDFQYRGMSPEEYTKTYGRPTGGEALRLVISDMLGEVLPENPLRLRAVDGTPMRGIRRARFGLGQGCQFFGLLPVGTQEGPGEPAGGLSITAKTDAWVGLEQEQHWYDVREGTYLGAAKMVRVALEPHRATLLAALPYKVERLSIKVRRSDPRGAFKVNVGVVADADEVGLHVFHVEIRDPAGKPIPCYARNIIAERGRWNSQVLLGLNEPAGMYGLVVRDVVTGKTVEGDLRKDAAEYTTLVH
ncbi:MAG: hypothetical protein NTW87_19050 [Planctomycetota bacterium]|nr:hypothetical protein [Planctomycetota bacterium]